MHPEILTFEQTRLLPVIKKFTRNFGLVGGTAVALQLGHRRSIDFDLFSHKKFINRDIEKKIVMSVPITKTIVRYAGEYTLYCGKVKITFYQFPFALDYTQCFDQVIKMPDVLTLAAMKAYALGQRSKWKDYVDLFFIMKDYFSIDEISGKAKELFAGEFNAKLFREQLSYFGDVDYREEVEFMPGFEVGKKTIEKALVEYSLS